MLIMEHQPAVVERKHFRSRVYSFQPETGACGAGARCHRHSRSKQTRLCSTGSLIGKQRKFWAFYGFMGDKTNIDSGVGFHGLEEQRGAAKNESVCRQVTVFHRP